MPIAVICLVAPRATLEEAGVTEMWVNATAVTVTAEVPVTPLREADIVAVPVFTAVTSPFVPAALLTEADAAFVDAQVTDEVMLTFVLSEYMPVAVNC
jgi:hypothetical protein